MEKRHMKSYIQASILCLSIVCILQACSVFSETTTVYGMITDEDGAPVDSIMVRVVGVKVNGSQNMAETFSDSNGQYEIAMDVAGKFTGLECLIPPNSPANVKYKIGYSGYDIFKDGKSAGFSIEKGEKNNLDFHLKTK